MLTILPGTTITLRGAAPASSSTIFSSANAAASMASGDASAGTVMRLRTLPLTWIGYSTESATSHFSSAVGKGPCASGSEFPSRDHSSSARCGATGAIINTSGSTAVRGAPDGYCFVR